MIRVEKLSYGFPAKDLYKEISFTLEDGQHCAFIGSNGTGKTTLIDMLIDPEKYLYDGKIIRDESCIVGYVNQFSQLEKIQPGGFHRNFVNSRNCLCIGSHLGTV